MRYTDARAVRAERQADARHALARWAWGIGIGALVLADALLIAVVAELWGWLR